MPSLGSHLIDFLSWKASLEPLLPNIPERSMLTILTGVTVRLGRLLTITGDLSWGNQGLGVRTQKLDIEGLFASGILFLRGKGLKKRNQLSSCVTFYTLFFKIKELAKCTHDES